MALDLGTLRIGIQADTQEANTALEKTKDKVKETEQQTEKSAESIKAANEKSVNSFKDLYSKAGNSLKQFGAKILDFAKVAAVAIGGLFVTGATIGMKYNAEMEGYQTNFKVMLGSEEAAVTKVEDLKKMAAATPFEMSDLASATQTLLQFGVASDDTQGIMQKLGDISLGNKEKFNSLSLVYGQVASQGKLMGQDLLQMINAGFNPLQVISEKTGESMASLKDKMSQGKITIDDVNQAMQWATESGGTFYNGMQEGSQTTEGLVSTLQDAVNSKLGEFFQTLSDKLKDLIPKITEFVNGIDCAAIIDTVKTAITDTVTVLEEWLPVIVGVTTAIIAYKIALEACSIIDTVRQATEGMTFAQAALNAVMAANPIALLIMAIAGLIAAVIVLWNTNEGFRNAVINIFTSVSTFFINLGNTIATFFTVTIPNWFNAALTTIGGFIGRFTKAGADIFNGLWDGLKSVWDSICSWVSEKVAWIADKLSFWKSSASEMQSDNVPAAGGRGHRTGLDYVPTDGYAALLHRGEMVLSRGEADSYRMGTTNNATNNNVNVYNTSPLALDEAETARLYKQSVRELALGM